MVNVKWLSINELITLVARTGNTAVARLKADSSSGSQGFVILVLRIRILLHSLKYNLYTKYTLTK